jgi:DNA-binding MarR family transcriptional regulator
VVRGTTYVYHTCVCSRRRRPAAPFARLDAALLALRRITQTPQGQPVVMAGATRVEMSTILVVDAVARAERSRASISDVGAALSVTPSTASRLVGRAESVGMVARRPADDDPRRTDLTLTPAGKRLQSDAVRYRTGRLRERLRDWDDRDVDDFVRLLERFADDVNLHEDNHP